MAAAILLVGYGVNAQDDKDADRVGGIRAGWHNAGMYKNGNMVPDADPLQSFYVGQFRDNKIIPVLHFSSGLEYFQNGVQFDSDNKQVLHYLSIPLSLKAKIGPVFAQTGFAPSFKVGEKIIINGNEYWSDKRYFH